MGLISRVSSRTYRNNMSKAVSAQVAEQGLFRHPVVHGGIADARLHRFPADTRMLRDVKLGEVPAWVMKRDFSPLGLWFGAKRLYMRSLTPHGHRGSLLPYDLLDGQDPG